MTLAECTKLLTPVALAVGHELDDADFRAYFHSLRDVPVPFLAVACDRAMKTPRGAYESKFPTAPKLREWAEVARQAASRAQPYVPCVACEDTCGWVPLPDGRVTRCRCWYAHQAKLASGGLVTPLALPAAELVEES